MGLHANAHSHVFNHKHPQCRVVDLWLEGSKDLSIGISEDTKLGRSSQGEVWNITPCTKDERDQILGHELLTDGLPHLVLDWTTTIDDLSPLALGGDKNNHVRLKTIFGEDSLSQDLTGTASAPKTTVQKYFVAQLFLAAEICLDRNYLAMRILEKQFTYITCITMLKDPKIPSVVKAGVAKLVTRFTWTLIPSAECDSHAFRTLTTSSKRHRPSSCPGSRRIKNANFTCCKTSSGYVYICARVHTCVVTSLSSTYYRTHRMYWSPQVVCGTTTPNHSWRSCCVSLSSASTVNPN